MSIPLPTSAAEQRIVRDIAEHGCHIIGILENEQMPSVAYSVGLYHSYGHPEVIVTGLRVEAMFAMINTIRDRVRDGWTLESGVPHDGLIEGSACVAREVDPERREFLRYAAWLYRDSHPDGYPVLQCVWPDREGRFPWDDGYAHEQLDPMQPMLWESIAY